MVAATIDRPLRGNAQKVGGKPTPPVFLIGANALVTRRRTAPDDAQVGDQYFVRERADGGPLSRSESARRARPCP